MYLTAICLSDSKVCIQSVMERSTDTGMFYSTAEYITSARFARPASARGLLLRPRQRRPLAPPHAAVAALSMRLRQLSELEARQQAGRREERSPRSLCIFRGVGAECRARRQRESERGGMSSPGAAAPRPLHYQLARPLPAFPCVRLVREEGRARQCAEAARSAGKASERRA